MIRKDAWCSAAQSLFFVSGNMNFSRAKGRRGRNILEQKLCLVSKISLNLYRKSIAQHENSRVMGRIPPLRQQHTAPSDLQPWHGPQWPPMGHDVLDPSKFESELLPRIISLLVLCTLYASCRRVREPVLDIHTYPF